MRLFAASSTALRGPLSRPARPAEWLGVGPTALYLRTGRSVVAVLTHDAVRLPCALVLPSTSAELPLTELPAGGDVCIGDGRVEWRGPEGTACVAASREWLPARVARIDPDAAAVAALADAACGADAGIDPEETAALAAPIPDAAVLAALLGRGPGLTPAGDDVLAGFLLGSLAFGCSTPGAFAAVRELAWSVTTALSAQLLDHAARGECVREAAAAIAALGGELDPADAFGRLLAVGHTSGAAVALGIVRAAERRLSCVRVAA